MDKLKPVFIFATIGFILSFLLSFLSGAAFWRMLLRALISGLICGAFYFAAKMLLEKYLPELFSNSNESTNDENPEKGQNLDIVLDDKDDKAEPKSQNKEASDTIYKDANLDNTPNVGEALASKEEASDMTDASTNTADIKNEDTATSHPSNDNGESDNELSEFKLSSTALDAEKKAPKGNTLDSLPNLAEFENSFDDTDSEITSDLVEAGTDGLRHDTSQDFTNENVNDMAKAIHTILKKDAT